MTALADVRTLMVLLFMEVRIAPKSEVMDNLEYLLRWDWGLIEDFFFGAAGNRLVISAGCVICGERFRLGTVGLNLDKL